MIVFYGLHLQLEVFLVDAKILNVHGFIIERAEC